MGQLRDAVKRHQEQKAQQPQLAAATRPQLVPVLPAPNKPKQPGKPPQQKIKPPVIGTEQVIALCGHEATLEHFAPKQDKYRDQRRKNMAAKACPQCRQAKQEKEMADAAERRKNKKRKPSNMVRVCAICNEKSANYRLPDKTMYGGITYDAAKDVWHGSIHTPKNEIRDEYVGHAESSGIFKLIQKLDRDMQDAIFPDGQRPYQLGKVSAKWEDYVGQMVDVLAKWTLATEHFSASELRQQTQELLARFRGVIQLKGE